MAKLDKDYDVVVVDSDLVELAQPVHSVYFPFLLYQMLHILVVVAEEGVVDNFVEEVAAYTQEFVEEEVELVAAVDNIGEQDMVPMDVVVAGVVD